MIQPPSATGEFQQEKSTSSLRDLVFLGVRWWTSYSSGRLLRSEETGGRECFESRRPEKGSRIDETGDQECFDARRPTIDRPAIGTWREGAGTPHPCELNEGGVVRICCGAVCFASMVKHTVRSLLDGAKKTARTADAHEPNEVVPRRLLDR
jgi:hypothetical protein